MRPLKICFIPQKCPKKGQPLKSSENKKIPSIKKFLSECQSIYYSYINFSTYKREFNNEKNCGIFQWMSIMLPSFTCSSLERLDNEVWGLSWFRAHF